MYSGFLDPDPRAPRSIPPAAAARWNQSGNDHPLASREGVKAPDVRVPRLALGCSGRRDRSPVLDWAPLEADSETRIGVQALFREEMAGHPSRGVGSEAGKGGGREMKLHQTTMGK